LDLKLVVAITSKHPETKQIICAGVVGSLSNVIDNKRPKKPEAIEIMDITIRLVNWFENLLANIMEGISKNPNV